MLIAIGKALLIASLLLTILVSVRDARKAQRSKAERLVDVLITVIAAGNLVVLIVTLVVF